MILNKILNTKIVGNVKFAVIALLFVGALAYAFCAIRGFVYNSEYSRTLSFQSLKLDELKEYLFVKEYKIAASPNTIIIPMGRVNMPDSLCTLYYEGEWKLKLTDNLRKSDEDNTPKTILYPYCRFEDKKNGLFFFHNLIKTPTQNDLLTGVRFNNASGRDAFVIKIKEQNGEYFLTKGVAFFTNRNVPVSNKKRNIVELDFCINGDTVGISKYVFSFPFLGSQHQPERKNIIIENDKINYNGNSQTIENDNFSFSVNDCVFQLKNNYSAIAKYFVLPLLFLFIIGFSMLMLQRLFFLTNKTQNSKQRNLIKVEQFNILSLRILFNCIILLGFPILLLKVQENESRLYPIALLAVILNINWINVVKWLAKKIRSDNRWFRVSSFIIVAVTILATGFTSNELVFGKIPVLKVTAIIFIFLPFAVSCFPKLPKIGFFDKIKERFLKIKERFLKNKEHSNINAEDKLEPEFTSNLTCYFVLIGMVLIYAPFIAKDFATLIFTLLSLFLLLIVNIKRFWNFIKIAEPKEKGLVVMSVIALSLVFWFFFTSPEKQYRFQSSLFFPDNEKLSNKFPNIEGSRETIAGQIFLLNSVENGIKPDFNTVVLPENKSVFFSDYAVLWSFKTGGWLWFSLYFGVLLMLSYTIISLLVIFSKPIKLKTGKSGFYNKKIIFGLNLLLAVMLVQYIYTFLTNFWTIPLTGQSPGLLSPAIYEYLFHIILINYLYVYLVSSVENRKTAIQQDTDTSSNISSYVPTKFKSFVFPFLVFVVSIVFLFYQRYRINGHIQENHNQMSWKIDLDSLRELKKYGKDTLLVLAHKSFEKMDGNADEQRKFRNCLLAYYESDNAKKRHYIDIAYIKNNTNIDSIASIKDKILQKEADVHSYSKYVNGTPTLFINNKYYGGCPPNAETVDFELQGKLNKMLEDWAERIDRKKDYKMIGGSIIVAENENGYILASASYPFMYNENLYHILYENKQINDVLQNCKVGAIPEYIKIKHDNPDYINFAEYDMMPGSIVKPLLAYCALKIGINIKNKDDLKVWLGNSSNVITSKIIEKVKDAKEIDSLNIVSNQNFGFKLYPHLTQNKSKKFSEKELKDYAIGQRDKLIFKNIVQAYMRIKTGNKLELSYKKKEHLDFELLSLDNEQLDELRDGMCALKSFKYNTAIGVGNTLKRKGINIEHFLAKTGTTEIEKPFNRTSAIIIVGNSITVGIQLYGVVPENDDGLSAQYLCKDLIENNLINLK